MTTETMNRPSIRNNFNQQDLEFKPLKLMIEKIVESKLLFIKIL